MKRQPSTGIGKWEVWTRQKNTSKYVWGLTRMFLVTNGHSWRLLHRPENICSPSSFWLGVPKYLPVKLRAVQKYYPDWHFTEIGIDKDHVHVHMVIPPKYSVSVAVEPIKKDTSRALREKLSIAVRTVRVSNISADEP